MHPIPEHEMDIKSFTELYNMYRSKLSPPHHPVTFPLTKRKTIKERVNTYEQNHVGVPILTNSVPPVTEEVFDTAGFGKLIQAMWEYFLGTKLKRISSEGSYRPGIGFIKSPNKGISDYMGAYKGITYFVETKQANEAYLKSQERFKQWAGDGGVPYITIRNFQQMFEFIKSIK